MVYFIYNPFTENHLFLINNLKYNLDLFNYKVEEIDQINSEEDDNIYIIIINHMFLIKMKAKNDYKNLLIKENIIYYRPLELIIEIRFYNKIINELKPMKVFTYCEENLKKIKPICSYNNFFPINKDYFKFVDIIRPEFKKKDFNKIVFIGKMNDYRNKLKEIFEDDLVVIDDKYKKEDWIKIINKYQYFVNVHRRPNSRCFETMRILPLLYNDCTVISEHVNQRKKNIKDGNLYFCKLEMMKEKLEIIKKKVLMIY